MAELRLVPDCADAVEGFSPRSPIRVVLAEDHPLLREGLRRLLDADEGIEVIAEAEDLASARRHVDCERPQVLVLDIAMISGAARETIGKLRARAPDTHVVLLAMDESLVVAQHVLACGALGFVLADRADGELAQAVCAGARGEKYISPRIAERLDAALRRLATEE
jgi:DNA-binding NarL/FixJ family response regulator